MNSLSIKYKIILSMIVLVVIFTILNTYQWNSRVTSDTEASATSYMKEMLKVTNDNFEVSLRDVDHIVAMLSINPEIINAFSTTGYSSQIDFLKDERKIESLIANELNFKRYLSGLMVTDLAGRMTGAGDFMRFDDVKKQSWYTDVLQSKGRKLIIGPYSYINGVVEFKNPESKDSVISIVRPIVKDDRVIGFVKADIRFNLLLDIFNVNLKDNASIIMLNQNGGWILKPPSELEPFILPEAVMKAWESKQEYKNNIYLDIAGEDTLAIFNHSSFTDWTTVGLIPKTKLLDGIHKTQRANLLFTSFMALISFAILYGIISILTRNLLLLSKAMKKIDRGNLDIAIHIKSQDEVGQLYNQFNRMVQRIQDLVESTAHNESEKRIAEMKALQAQINPHFLYNTLNTIKFLAQLQGAEGIRDVSESLATLMHVNMDSRRMITVHEEVEYLTNYLRIQEYKYNSKFISRISVENEIKNASILKLLLQPIVENALRHGIAGMKGQGILVVKIYKSNDSLIIDIEDNGVGMDEEKIIEIMDDDLCKKSIGIINVRKRLSLYYGELASFNIVSEKHYFTHVKITQPYIVEIEEGKDG
ncbi:sensor histidine kinase [Paenibacillus sp. Soil750]|uniref:sensor histidine kinase n=1 Tax=Paenibacillus sp. Soil750 TaxID=1736398 RepID=UPI0006FF7562|nr:sensor histidine kinase [Paenibacillus sp. Soil750]KRE69763.1 hypothetical protein ASL11_15475 [Paenibacillus sp. Soil750]